MEVNLLHIVFGGVIRDKLREDATITEMIFRA